MVDLRDRVLDVVLKYPRYKLIGAYSIVKNMKDKDWEARATTDLDIRICCDICDENNIDHLIKILNDEGLKTTVKLTKSNNFKVFITDETGDFIKVDIEFKPGNDIESNIKNLKESLRDKLELVMLISDREFKNLVDVIICLHSCYPDGVSKQDLLDIAKNINLHSIDLETQFSLANKFKPNALNGLTMKEYAIYFDTLIFGLLEDSISHDCLFKDGKWYNT